MLDEVLKFADVAAPLEVDQGGHCLRREGELFTIPLHRIGLDEVVDEQGDVFTSCLERRDRQRYDTQTVIEVLPELPFVNHLFEVAVGGCQDSGIHGRRFQGTHRLELFLLEYPQ